MTTDAEATPSDLRKARMKDFYFTIGVAMVQWQHVEYELNELFCVLVGSDHRVASAVFSTITSFPTKLRMVKAAALVRLGETDLFDQCRRLSKYLDEDVEGSRNRIAHFMMYWDIPAGEDLEILEDVSRANTIRRGCDDARASRHLRSATLKTEPKNLPKPARKFAISSRRSKLPWLPRSNAWPTTGSRKGRDG
jgi:hypothetical protein